MKLNTKKIVKGFTLVELLVVIAIIAALAALATPVVLKQQKKAAATEAVNNAKQIFCCVRIRSRQRSLPRRRNHHVYWCFAATSNEAFREFFIDSQSILRSSSTPNWLDVPPDGDIGEHLPTRSHGAGECGFHYS